MRPVKRSKNKKVFLRYQDAIGDLEDCLGRYCSYCERHFKGGLAVEHVVPKSVAPSRRLDWNNFLLACDNCNSVKGKKKTNSKDFLWPDRDNTLRALEYKTGGLVGVNKTLSPSLRNKTERLIDLVGLDRHPGQPAKKQPAKRDCRHSDREEVWRLATFDRAALARNNNEDFRVMIVAHAKSEGFFSVWMSVFHDDSDMRRRFIFALKGTAKNCFNKKWKCVNRPGGRI